LENGALGKKFDAYPKRQFVTESININSLADHHIWSTIKTLPATLPEPSFKDGVSCAGVTGAVCQSDLDFCQGVGGRYWVWALAPRTLVVGLAEATVGNFLGFLKFLHQYFLHYQNSFAGT
jgi:hypothetical protein